MKKNVMNNTFNVASFWKTDKEVVAITLPFTNVTCLPKLILNYNQEFKAKWKIGFDNYINGDWKSAQRIFEETLV